MNTPASNQSLNMSSGRRTGFSKTRFAIVAIMLGTTVTLAGCGVTQADHDLAAAEIAYDILGESMWTGENTWTFAGEEEFESIKIVSVNGNDNETRFILDMNLVDMYSREKWNARIGVEYYHYGDSNWTLSSINCINWSRRY